MPDRYFVPMRRSPVASGALRQPATRPTGWVSLRHIHGREDRVVAFDEIGVYNSMLITDGMLAPRRLNGRPGRPNETSRHPRYACEQR